MANLRDMRLRMRAITQTLQVTKAMKLISTAKLKKARRLLEDTEPYFSRIQKAMFDLLSGVQDVDSVFFRGIDPVKQSRTAIVVITSDKGLAGGYNANIFRQVNDLCTRVRNPILILIGSIGYRYFAHSSMTILENFTFRSQVSTVAHAKEVADYVVSQFLSGMIDAVHIVYTHMYSAIKQQPVSTQILPLDIEQIKKELALTTEEKRVQLHFEFIPSEEAVFDALVPLYIKGIIYGCMVESYASEQSSRMAAMDEASKSADEILAGLQISYNRARQAGITQEMSEIVGGSTALADRG